MEDDNNKDDYELQTLLSFNNLVYYMKEGRYWVKFDVYKVTPTKHVPHGIRYSITLHDRNNTRIIGYDNAHNCLPKSKSYKAQKVTWDHIHKREKVEAYEFDSASQLIEDFWETVNQFIG